MKYLSIAIILALALFLAGCDVRKDAVGSYNKIPILIDDGEFEELMPLLEDAIGREIITPRHETIFKLYPVDSTRYAWLKNARTSIVVASLESPGPAGQMIRGSLSPDALKAIKSNMRWIIVRKDLWSKDQMVIFLTAPTEEALSVQLGLNGNQVYGLINNSVNNRVSEWLYSKAFGEGEQTALEDSIAADYGFGIRVPKFWDWEKGNGEERFIWLRTLEPERWVFVWWAPIDTTVDYDIAWWRHVRDSLCEVYYEGDSVAERAHLRMANTKIGDRPAVELRGLWENRASHYGVPFVSYIVSDRITQRVFIIDGAVFAPVIEKERYLRHVEIVCRSFRGDLPRFYEERSALDEK